MQVSHKLSISLPLMLMLFLTYACNNGHLETTKTNSMNSDTTQHNYTNALIHETSPYLLQHAHNPVEWHPWNEETLAKAQKEGKLLLISIGYSACHWCHVMEHECFEDEEVAEIMNEHFICIKVDREERPDIDQIYMNAVQLVTGRGGWPLNCFALPNGEPFYGGTYFPKKQWIHVLKSIASEYQTDREKIIGHAQKLTKGVKSSDLLPKIENDQPFSLEPLEVGMERFKKQMDWEEGGQDRAPKFPLPNNYEFLLQYHELTGDKEALKSVEITLDKMAYGGIYDQVGGGFARYSTDSYWKIPHFEKMLYDNGQLVSLYSKAYQKTKKPLYKHVVYQTLDFIEREMTTENGAFYSALDADSEGEEGKFYVWTEAELKEVLKSDYEFAKEYYTVNHKGEWEGNYILLRDKSDAEICIKFDLTAAELTKKMTQINAALLKARSNRIRPGLDDKTLTSWNALMLKGYVDAYKVFSEKRFLDVALKNAEFLATTQLRKDGGLNHNYKNGVSNLDGYLEDYALTIEAFIALYEITFDEQWLTHAKALTNYSIDHFYDKTSGFFYFTSDQATGLIARKMELSDNVIPASNSSMAKGLFLLGEIYEDEHYSNISDQMLKNIEPQISQYLPGYSNWAMLSLQHLFPFYMIAIVGEEAQQKRITFDGEYIPNKMFVGSRKDSKLPPLALKYVNGKTMIYVCYNKSCQKPVETVKDALVQIEY